MGKSRVMKYRERALPRALTLLLLLGVLGMPCSALAFYELESQEGDRSLEATGAFRLSGAWMHLPDVPLIYKDGDDGLAALVGRLLLSGGLHEKVGYELNVFVDLTRSPSVGTGGTLSTVGASATPYRAPHLAWNFWEDGSVGGQLGLDRLAFTARLDPVVIKAGRFPVNFSVTNMFTPNDLFAPFSATSINKIYKPGVDAVRVGWAPGEFTQLTLVGVLGWDSQDEPTWSRSAVLLRASTVLWNQQLSLLGGRVAGRWLVGASLQGEAGPLGLRAEGHVGFRDDDGDGTLDTDSDGNVGSQVHVKVAAGVDHRFDWRNATVGFEAYYQSDGANRPARYIHRAGALLPDELPYLGQLYMGVSGGLELLPILNLGGMVLLNATDFSGLATLSLIYNIADEADAVMGVLVPWGEEPVAQITPVPQISLESEYGAAPLMVFLETRFYF